MRSLSRAAASLYVIAQAWVGEQVARTRVQEQLCGWSLLNERLGYGSVHLGPFVGVHHMDLKRDRLGPRGPEFGGRHARMEEQRPARTWTRPRQGLRRQHTQREAGIDDVGR